MAQIALLGLGTIGASLGLALRRDKAWSDVVGYDPAYPTQRSAVSKGAVRSAADSPEAAVREADLVVVNGDATRVAAWIRAIASAVKRGAVVTDTASAKRSVAETAREALPSYVTFVGGHPSVAAAGQDDALADPLLFRRRTWYLAPAPGARESAVDVVCGMVEVAEGVAQFVDPAEHDSWCAAVDHLPAILAAALVAATAKSGGWRDMQRLASGNYLAASQLASADAAAHAGDALAFRASLAPWLEEVEGTLRDVRSALTTMEDGRIRAFFAEAKGLRETWLSAREQGYPDDTSAALESVRPRLSAKALFRRRA